MEAQIAILPRSVAIKGQRTWVSVVDESLLGILESHTVLDDVVGRRVVCNTQLEAISITLKTAKVPAVEAVTPSVHLVQSDGRAKHVQI